eukprot:11190678-Lingulodinium_polyedra.AAC.1
MARAMARRGPSTLARRSRVWPDGVRPWKSRATQTIAARAIIISQLSKTLANKTQPWTSKAAFCWPKSWTVD